MHRQLQETLKMNQQVTSSLFQQDRAFMGPKDEDVEADRKGQYQGGGHHGGLGLPRFSKIRGL